MSGATRPLVLLEDAGVLGWTTRRPGAARAELVPFVGSEQVLARLAARARVGVVAGDDGSAPSATSRAATTPAVRAARDAGPSLPESLARHALVPAGLPMELAACGPATPRLYVSRDRRRRAAAREAGWEVAPDPALVEAVLDGARLAYAVIEGMDVAGLAAFAGHAVPLHQVRIAGRVATCAILTDVARRELSRTGHAVRVLGGHDVVASAGLFHAAGRADDALARAFRERVARVCAASCPTDDGIVFALGTSTSLLELDPPLGCERALVELRALPPPARVAAGTKHAVPRGAAPAAACTFTPEEREALARLDEAAYAACLAPWWKERGTLPCGLAVESRHAWHPHNEAVVRALVTLLARICGDANVSEHEFSDPVGNVLRSVVAVIPPAAGSPYADEVVVLSAHLDAVATDGAAYVAPGVNDDASGMAGVLAAASVLRRLSEARPPLRELRLVLFNGEEIGMAGSYQWVADQLASSRDRRIVAAFQLDMIGYAWHGYPPAPFEVHTGARRDLATFPGLAEESARLGALVSTAVRELVPQDSLVPQVYPADPDASDPGAFDSDHSWFLARGIPACLVCEDFYTEGAHPSRREGHPTYHSLKDVVVNTRYAADLSRAVAGAVWLRANAQTHNPEENVFKPREVHPVIGGPGYQPGRFAAFLSEFLSNPSFRFSVLNLELVEMEQYGLTSSQRLAIQSLNEAAIVSELKADIANWGADLAKLYTQVRVDPPKSCNGSASGPQVEAAAMYSQDKTLILEYPASVSASGGSMTIRGLGFDRDPQVAFKSCATGELRTAVTTGVGCGQDLYQHVSIDYPALTPGDWLVLARNDSAEDFVTKTERPGKVVAS